MADLIISQPMTFTVDVKTGLVERPQRESLMRGDRYANRIVVELVDGSEPFDIAGVTVKGEFCKPPNGDSIDLPGEAKGNVAEVQLTDQCYTAGGHYEARVILVLGEVKRTVLFISGDVLKSGSGNEAGEEPGGEPGGGSTGSGLPAGGTAGQVLVKVSSAQGDAIWKTLTAADVGARPANWMPTAEDVNALPSDGTAANANALNGKNASEYALKIDLPTTAADVGALPATGTAADSAKLGGVVASEYATKSAINSEVVTAVEERIAQITDSDAADMAEVISARTDEDGVAHVSLKTRIDSGISQLKDQIENVGALYPTWAKGYYAHPDGVPKFYPATNRISFAEGELLTPEYPCEVTIKNGYKFWVNLYDAKNNRFLYAVGPKTGSHMLDVGYAYSITTAREDDGVIEFGESGCAFFEKKIESRIEDQEERLDHVGINMFNLVSGVWYAAEPPYFGSTTTRLATPEDEYVEFESDAIITPKPGYGYMLFRYNRGDKVYVGSDSWTQYSKTLTSEYAYRINVRKNDNSNISTTERDCIFYSLDTKPAFDSRYFRGLYETRFFEKENNIVSEVLADKTVNTLTFGVITDTHHAQLENHRTAKHGKALAKLCGRVGATFMVHLGDVIEGERPTLAANKYDLAEYWGEQNDASVPILYTLAHHEQYGAKGVSGWGNDTTSCPATNCMGMYGYTTKHLNVVKSPDGLSWYTDVRGVRCIGLDSCSNGAYGYSQAVVDFLTAALETSNKVMIFAHVAPLGDVMTNGVAPTNGNLIISAIDAHAQSDVIAFFHGHTHWDNHYKSSDGIWYISTCCALPERVSEELFCPAGNPTAYDRTVGDYTEYCFDIVNVHLDTGNIKTFRFGAGTNREIK